MKMFKAFGALAFAALLVPGVALAAPPMDEEDPESAASFEISDDISATFMGYIRTRFEWNNNLTDFSEDDHGATDDEFGFVPSRFRLGVRFDLPEDVAFTLDVQNTTAFGEDTPDRLKESGNATPANAPTSGAFLSDSHRDDIGVYQAYISANNIGGTLFSAHVGRQEYEYGNELMLGVADFYGGTSLDGIKGVFEFDKARLDLIWSKLDEQNTGAPAGVVNFGDDDTDLYGAYLAWPNVADSEIGLDFYGLYLRSGFDGGPAAHDTRLRSMWAGARIYRQPETGFHFNAEVVWNGGDFTPVSGGPEFDIQAWAAETSLGYTWDVTGMPDIHGGWSFFSGDDDGGDQDQESFVQLLPDIHPRAGFADVIDVFTNVSYWQVGYMGSHENHSWGIEVYGFTLDEENGATPISSLGGWSGATDDALGHELDLYYNYQYSRNLALQFVAAIFDPDDAIEHHNNHHLGGAIDTDEAWRGYINAVLSF